MIKLNHAKDYLEETYFGTNLQSYSHNLEEKVEKKQQQQQQLEMLDWTLGLSRLAAAGRSYPMPEARGGGWEEQPHFQAAMAAWVQEGREKQLHIQGQEELRWGDTPLPR